MRKIIFAICTLFLVTSCSTDDEVIENQQKEAKYRIEVSHEGNKEEFTEFNTYTFVATSKTITASGLEGFQSIIDDKTHNFVSVGLGNPTNRTIETSDNILSVSTVVALRSLHPNSGNEVNTTISIYKNDELFKRETHTFKGVDALESFTLSSE